MLVVAEDRRRHGWGSGQVRGGEELPQFVCSPALVLFDDGDGERIVHVLQYALDVMLNVVVLDIEGAVSLRDVTAT